MFFVVFLVFSVLCGVFFYFGAKEMANGRWNPERKRKTIRYSVMLSLFMIPILITSVLVYISYLLSAAKRKLSK